MLSAALVLMTLVVVFSQRVQLVHRLPLTKQPGYLVEKARDMLRSAADRALDATADAREKFDFPSRGEFEALARRVAELEERLGVRTGNAGDRTEDEAGR